MESGLDFKTIKALAEQGSADAQYEYGWRLICDDSSQENCHIARDWFRKAAEQEHPKALWRMGTSFEMVDDAQAIYWYRRSAEAGHPIAQWWLGVKYQSGNGVIKDAQQAFFWFKRAAERGDADACRELGAIFEKGEGIEQDWQQAALWYKLASAKYCDLWRAKRSTAS